MDREPTNQEVAAVVGIEESQVEKYRQDALLLGDGSWLVNFSYDMPRELRHSFTGSFTAVVACVASDVDARSVD
ncbi:hypothetical protein DV532_13125 [Pseudomonas sp. Leaf58]|uniref:hypothetical protein n=1 Tax=Pseudomonas TaxID=286 RepID=UPI0006F4E967|nr:hypothetical protein [Pseudomonas sp. Leaf58]AYG45187.1 hypothetical protein DV532_13125 [Pseudomonas sp. Leaf58]KQN59269.1 hypothetical protein ASF02_20655 [Pseudomonas sp. Leaf58]